MIVAKHDLNVAAYCKLKTILKKRSINYVAKKSSILTTDNINILLKAAVDKFYFVTKLMYVNFDSFD